VPSTVPWAVKAASPKAPSMAIDPVAPVKRPVPLVTVSRRCSGNSGPGPPGSTEPPRSPAIVPSAVVTVNVPTAGQRPSPGSLPRQKSSTKLVTPSAVHSGSLSPSTTWWKVGQPPDPSVPVATNAPVTVSVSPGGDAGGPCGAVAEVAAVAPSGVASSSGSATTSPMASLRTVPIPLPPVTCPVGH